MRWIFNEEKEQPSWFRECVASLKLSNEVVKLVSQLSFSNEQELRSFLQPSLKEVEDPYTIPHLSEAVQIIDKACLAHQSIAIVSDYDVDGVTSMALMDRCFKSLGYHFTAFFPDREREGYGLTERVVERILSQSQTFDYLISLDCGTNSVLAIQRLRDAGIEVIVVDHHQCTCNSLPDAILINPHVNEAAHSISSKEFCTAGLVFKWIHAWFKYLKQKNPSFVPKVKLRQFLDLVALGSIADVVPLRHENRLWVHFGLKEMLTSEIPGLRHLIEVAGIHPKVPLTVDDVSYKLAPRINVSGRLDSAHIPYRLLTNADGSFCRECVLQLDALNKERQAIEAQILQEAESMILANPNRLAYVLFQPTWHAGVVGIVAGRLTRKYNCPVFVLGEQEGFAKGSGRSIPDVNLVEILSECQAYIKQWGGHPAAVGLTVTIENIRKLEDAIHAHLAKKFPTGLPEGVLHISSKISPEKINESFLCEIERLAPFGHGNETPVFVLEKVYLETEPKHFGKNNSHLRFNLNGIPVVGWNQGDTCFPEKKHVDLAVCCSRSSWLNTSVIQLQLLDWRPSNID